MSTQMKEVIAPLGSPAWFVDMVDKSTSPVMTVIDLTPKLAEFMLGMNGDNRSVRRAKVTQYSSDMSGGSWVLNGEPIIISTDGKLNDGQHRCIAVDDSNATIPTTIVFGMERETRLTVDQGAARSASDFLAMEGVPNASQSAAIARMLIAFERSEGKNLAAASFITSTEVRQRVARDAEIAMAATFAATNYTYTRTFAAASLVGFAFCVLSRVHMSDARIFLERVSRGDGLKLRDPAHTLREKLMADGKIGRDRKIAMILRAWNFHRRGMKVAPNSLTSTLPFPALI